MSRLHELLPWYANGTLEAPEAAAFEDHLRQCSECRDELSIISRMSPDDFGEHPSPPAMMEAIRPGTGDDPLEPEALGAIRRHLALCPTCSEEARWLTGEAVARKKEVAMEVSRSPAPGWIGWAALSAAVIVLTLAIGIMTRTGGSSVSTGVLSIDLVPSAERSGGRPDVTLPGDSTTAYLLFEVDLALEEFPASFSILDSNGRTIFVRPELKASDLYNATGLLFACSRADCPDGDYTARLSPGGRRRPDVEYPFRLTTAP